jgi:hypothetical protein
MGESIGESALMAMEEACGCVRDPEGLDTSLKTHEDSGVVQRGVDLPVVRVNVKESPQFRKLIEHFRKSYPAVEQDMREALAVIAQDFRHAKRANAIPGFGAPLYKYRQNSSDIRRGSSFGWRIIAYYHEATHTLYPLLVYPKTELADADRKDVEAALREIREVIAEAEKQAGA